MNKLDIIRAWKDELFRKSLTSDQQSLLPEHPAGEIVLSDKEMNSVNGGANTAVAACITQLCQSNHPGCINTHFIECR